MSKATTGKPDIDEVLASLGVTDIVHIGRSQRRVKLTETSQHAILAVAAGQPLSLGRGYLLRRLEPSIMTVHDTMRVTVEIVRA